MKKISGVGKRHILKNFFKRINTPYDLRIRNAIDGEEMLHLALTKKSIYLIISTFLVASFILVSLLFLFTPIKYYIPGYETNASRKKLIQLHTKIEELEQEQRGYNKMVRNVGGVITDDEKLLLDTVSLTDAQLNSAEMNNESQINSAFGKKRVVGKRRVDTTKRNKKGNLLTTKKVLSTNERTDAKPIKKRVKKRDTIITYQ